MFPAKPLLQRHLSAHAHGTFGGAAKPANISKSLRREKEKKMLTLVVRAVQAAAEEKEFPVETEGSFVVCRSCSRCGLGQFVGQKALRSAPIELTARDE